MIHKFTMNGLNLVMDINSGAIHIPDEAAFCVLSDYKEKSLRDIISHWSSRFSESVIREAFCELQTLEEEGSLFSDEFSILPKIYPEPVIKALCLHVAHDCNLRCRYCFAGKGDFAGERSLMPPSVGKQAVDLLLTHSKGRRNLEIDFFGGEPTMNFETIKEIVNYGREQEKKHGKNIRFTLTTNGLMLNDDMQEFINAHMQNVVLSIDGRQEVNDRMRPNIAGAGSYHSIVPKFQKLAESRRHQNYYVRGTYTRDNLDFSEDVLHLAGLGFRNISVEPVVSESSPEWALRPDDLPVLFAEYEKLAQAMLARMNTDDEFQFFHYNIDFTGGPCVYKRLTGCGAGTAYLSVTPDGYLYPCHQFAGMDNFKLGHVSSDVTNENLRHKFARMNIFAKEECRDCWAKFYCGGGCAANAYLQNGDLLTPYALGCALQKKRVECAVYLAAASAIADVERSGESKNMC